MTTAKPRPPLAPGETRAYPVLPLRDIIVFPHMIEALFVGRKKSILALEEAIRSDSFILLATQKNASDDEPAPEAIYEIGTLASVLQLLKLPDGTVKVVVEGAQRAKVVKYTDCSDYYEVEAVVLGDTMGERVEAKALGRVATAEHLGKGVLCPAVDIRFVACRRWHKGHFRRIKGIGESTLAGCLRKCDHLLGSVRNGCYGAKLVR